MTRRLVGLVLMICFIMSLAVANAASTTEQENDRKNAIRDLKKAWIIGPAKVSLIDQGEMALPQGFAFVPKKEANQFIHAMGMPYASDFIGLVMPQSRKEGWIIFVYYGNAGYMKGDDAKKWDIDELYQGLQEERKKANEVRREQGLEDRELNGWVEKPQYDEVNNRLIWSISINDKTENYSQLIYNGYILGREGYLHFTLMGDTENIEAKKMVVEQILNATTFIHGKRYRDIDKIDDVQAFYDLTSLVSQAAVEKAEKEQEFWSMILDICRKLDKAIGLIAAGLVLFLIKRWKKRKAEKAAKEEKEKDVLPGE